VNRFVTWDVQRLEPSDILDWEALTGNIVLPAERTVLKAMDVAYCNAMRTEVENNRARAASRGKRAGNG